MALLSVNERVRKPAAFGIQNTVGRKQRTVHRVCVRSDPTMLYVRRCKSTGLWVSLKKRHPFHACVRKTRRNTSRYVVARSRHLSCPDPPVSAVFPSKIHERSNKWSSTTCGKWWKEHDDRSLFSFPDSSPPPPPPVSRNDRMAVSSVRAAIASYDEKRRGSGIRTRDVCPKDETATVCYCQIINSTIGPDDGRVFEKSFVINRLISRDRLTYGPVCAITHGHGGNSGFVVYSPSPPPVAHPALFGP